MNASLEIASALLEIGAVGFAPQKPITFKSGIVSPVYVDNRRFPYHPQQWRKVIAGFVELLAKKQLKFDVIAGIETAGIPHSAALGYELQKPSVFVRKQVKDHGTKSRVEGGSVQGKRLLLLEDLVTTGGSSLSGVEALRNEGAIVTDCIVICSYGFIEAQEAFKQAGVNLHALVGFPEILEEAERRGLLNASERESVAEWFQDPHGWGETRSKKVS